MRCYKVFQPPLILVYTLFLRDILVLDHTRAISGLIAISDADLEGRRGSGLQWYWSRNHICPISMQFQL